MRLLGKKKNKGKLNTTLIFECQAIYEEQNTTLKKKMVVQLYKIHIRGPIIRN